MVDQRRWNKFFNDFSSTRIQLIYWVAALITIVTLRALALVKTAEDSAALLRALEPMVLLVLGTYVTGKVIEAKSAPPQ